MLKEKKLPINSASNPSSSSDLIHRARWNAGDYTLCYVTAIMSVWIKRRLLVVLF